MTDLILSDSDKFKDITAKYELMDVSELFQILEKNSDFITNPTNLSTWKFKQLLIISKILEQKLDTNTLDIVEIR